jgi:hypothetical protein
LQSYSSQNDSTEEGEGQAFVVKRAQGELEEKLREQSELLQVQAQTYDEGKHIIALSGATTLRVLLHQTANSHTLLQQMDLLTSLRFTDTAAHILEKNLLSIPGLVHMKIEVGKGASFEAPLSNLPPPRLRQSPLPLEPWWSTPILNGPTGATWSRKDLVLYETNKEGGAHIDPNISDAELRQVEEDAFGLRFTDGNDTTKFLNGPYCHQFVRSCSRSCQHSSKSFHREFLAGGFCMEAIKEDSEQIDYEAKMLQTLTIHVT